MPSLKSKTTKVVLPSSKDAATEDQAYVFVKQKLALADIIAVNTGDSDLERTVNGLAVYITDWNYADDDGVKTPITKETIVELDKDDYNFLATMYNDAFLESHKGVSDDEKKTSSDTLTPPTTIAIHQE